MPDRFRIAREIIEIVPLMMRNVSADLRCHRAGLAPAHLRVLGMLFEQPHSLSELADLQAVTPATMSNSVTTMVERGWVERVSAPADRRVVMAHITPAGQQILFDAHRQLENRILESIASLPEEDLESLEKGLHVLNRVLVGADWSTPVSACQVQSAENNGVYPDSRLNEIEGA